MGTMMFIVMILYVTRGLLFIEILILWNEPSLLEFFSCIVIREVRKHFTDVVNCDK